MKTGDLYHEIKLVNSALWSYEVGEALTDTEHKTHHDKVNVIEELLPLLVPNTVGQQIGHLEAFRKIIQALCDLKSDFSCLGEGCPMSQG